MTEIKNLLLHYTKSSELLPENLMLAKKAALLELKFSKEDFIIVNDKKYSKEELIQLFDYYQDPLKIGLFETLENLFDKEELENPQSIISFSSYKDDFYELENSFQVQEYISHNYFTNFFKAQKRCLKSNTNQKYEQLRKQISYLFYFKPSDQDKVKSYFRNYFLAEFESMRARKFILDSNADYKNHFLFSIDFIQFCGDIGNDDQDFLHEVLDVTHDFYNTFLKMQYLMVNALKEHKKLNHSIENQLNLDSNIALLDTKGSPKARKDFAWKYLFYVGILLLFILRNAKMCQDGPNNFNRINIPNLDFKPIVYPSNSYDSIFSDTILKAPKIKIPKPTLKMDSIASKKQIIQEHIMESQKAKRKYDSLKVLMDSTRK